MTSVGRKYKFLLFIALSAMMLSQSIAAGHDQFHHHLTDDCVVCKIVEVSHDKANLVQATVAVLPRLSVYEFEVAQLPVENNLWRKSLSRAPPAS